MLGMSGEYRAGVLPGRVIGCRHRRFAVELRCEKSTVESVSQNHINPLRVPHASNFCFSSFSSLNRLTLISRRAAASLEGASVNEVGFVMYCSKSFLSPAGSNKYSSKRIKYFSYCSMARRRTASRSEVAPRCINSARWYSSDMYLHDKISWGQVTLGEHYCLTGDHQWIHPLATHCC